MKRCPYCQALIPDYCILHRDFPCCGGRRPEKRRQ